MHNYKISPTTAERIAMIVSACGISTVINGKPECVVKISDVHTVLRNHECKHERTQLFKENLVIDEYSGSETFTARKMCSDCGELICES